MNVEYLPFRYVKIDIYKTASNWHQDHFLSFIELEKSGLVKIHLKLATLISHISVIGDAKYIKFDARSNISWLFVCYDTFYAFCWVKSASSENNWMHIFIYKYIHTWEKINGKFIFEVLRWNVKFVRVPILN